jgi:hypothetical protein
VGGFRIQSDAVAKEDISALYGSEIFSSSAQPIRCTDISAVASNGRKSIIPDEFFFRFIKRLIYFCRH